MRYLSRFASNGSQSARPTRYLAVAAMGAAVQAVVVLAASRAGWPAVGSTVLAIEAAILHNFAWHDRWTWGDRPVAHRGGRLRRLLRYNAAMAATSLAAGAGVAWIADAWLGWPVLVSNAVAVVAASVANYVLSDRAIFQCVDTTRADRRWLLPCAMRTAAPRGDATRRSS